MPVTLKQGQSHDAYTDNVDPEQGYYNAMFERSCCNGVQEKANIIFFFSNEAICQSSPVSVCESGINWQSSTNSTIMQT